MKQHAKYILVAVFLIAAVVNSKARLSSGTNYTYPVDKLTEGQSLGNSDAYITLDQKTDLLDDRKSVRHGLKESTNQTYYLLGWDLGVASSAGKEYAPVATTFSPAFQESELRSGNLTIRKTIFVPFENGYLRSAHFVLDVPDRAESGLTIRSHLFFPGGVKVKQKDFKGHTYVTASFNDGTVAVVWGSGSLRSLDTRLVADGSLELVTEYTWLPSSNNHEYALSFA